MTTHESGRDFIPINPNPYIVGTPVRDPSMFFGRESEFELVQRRFRAATHGGLIVFCGERRSGKTSILFQILQGRLGKEFIPVLIDMQSMVIDSELRFLERITEEILQVMGPSSRLAPPKFEAGCSPPTVFFRFIEDFARAHPSRKLILLFDEYELFENKIEAGALTEDVLNILSSLMEKQSVFLIFTGSQNVEERRRSYWKILPKSIYRTISYLQPEDTRRLIEKPIESRVSYGAGTVDAICRLTAGQPFYTQAICQGLIDSLNERQTCVVTMDILEELVRGIVDNPFPQMIFLWDGLEADEKLVLALAAEVLDEDGRHATAEQLLLHLRAAQYPLDITQQRVASALEALFKQELLGKSASPPYGYIFRMDLWRLWIRRMHSVWQVMREIGIDVPRSRSADRAQRRHAQWGVLAGALIVLGAIGIWWGSRLRPAKPGGSPSPANPVAEAAAYRLAVIPVNASIYREDVIVATGTYEDSIPVGGDTRFRLTAEGHTDSIFVVRPSSSAPLQQRISLRPALGSLEIETSPRGARIWLDDSAIGRSPITVRGLPTSGQHAVRASFPGRGDASQHVALKPDSTIVLRLELPGAQGSLSVLTIPEGAELLIDGADQPRTPVMDLALPLGRHSVRALKDGFVPRDTTILVGSEPLDLHLLLAPVPTVILEIQGDSPARMFVDGRLVASNLPNSGRLRLSPGPHEVTIVSLTGDTLRSVVDIRPREQVIYDYTAGSVTSRRPMGAPPQ